VERSYPERHPAETKTIKRNNGPKKGNMCSQVAEKQPQLLVGKSRGSRESWREENASIEPAGEKKGGKWVTEGPTAKPRKISRWSGKGKTSGNRA